MALLTKCTVSGRKMAMLQNHVLVRAIKELDHSCPAAEKLPRYLRHMGGGGGGGG